MRYVKNGNGKNGKQYNYYLGVAGLAVVGGLLTVAMLFNVQYDRPPLETVQNGFRGTAMEQVYNPRVVEEQWQENQIPAPPMPLVTAGPKASDVYENVQVLGDLSQTQFTRLMLAITAWVSPEQGCTYCHQEGEGFEADTLYTKRVSRWMIQMTRHINNNWQNHVLETGVTCYTCHRGNNLPQYVWWIEPTHQSAMLGYSTGFDGVARQNVVNPQALYASLPSGAFEEYLLRDEQIRVLGETALPIGQVSPGTKHTELTYSLMMHMSGSLGVNCTYCHNTRAMGSWEQSPPQRVNAWYGIRMVRELNTAYMEPTTPTLPPYRLGPTGDAPKANCTTCHQGVYKPLFGQSMLQDYPSLAAPNVRTREELLPGLVDAQVSMQLGAQWASPPASGDGSNAATPASAPATGDGSAAPAGDGSAAPADSQAAPSGGDAPAATDTPAAPAGDQSDAAEPDGTDTTLAPSEPNEG